MSKPKRKLPRPSKTLLGAAFRLQRKRLKMTQVELSAITGVTQGAIAKVELGMTSDPSVRVVAKLVKGLRMKAHDVLMQALKDDEGNDQNNS